MKTQKEIISWSFFLSLLILIMSLGYSNVDNVNAEEAFSETRKLGWTSINSFAGESYSETYNLVDTGGQLGIEVYESENYKVMSGFGYYYSLIPFSFTIDSIMSIDFESLSPNVPQTGYTDLTVSSGAAHGYIVSVHQNHQLENTESPGEYIEDTIGDNEDISYTQQGMWELNTTHGFGYSLSNLEGGDAVFTSGYRKFADLSKGHSSQIMMQNSEVTRTSSVRLNYKVNIGSEQDSGNYESSIFYKCSGTF